MYVYFGNLTIEEMEKRLGITFPSELREYLEKNHQPKAEGVKRGQWHCFDAPFVLAVGDMETAQMIVNYLKPFAKDVKTFFQVAVYNETENEED